ncbi:MAG: type II toxin-antitoxin system Phd/YefM family antitoxin [Acidobacteria bacterium]|nr:type II toxin-antitoxin system Phd/YefM family antitoxin [Acidobacteriota bacterium]MCI0717799.1 type II toxin-antitoxin system Phd/YefM family antitoxin [Acidobacteriota bacterium]
MKKVALSEVKDDLSKFLRVAEKEEVVITRHGKAAGILIGFESEDDWFDYRLANDPRFLQRIESARMSLRSGRGVPLEDIDKTPNEIRIRAARLRRRKPGAGRFRV